MGSIALARSSAETSDMEAAGTAPVSLETAAGLISLTITSDLPSIASVWREIADAAVCTSAQTFDWARAWSTHVLTPAGRASKPR